MSTDAAATIDLEAGSGGPAERWPVYQWIERLAGWGALAVVGVGAAVIAGWALGIETLKRLRPDLVAMNPATALCLVLAGVSLWLRVTPGASRGRVALGRVAAACVVAIGAARLAAYILGSEAGIDAVLTMGGAADPTGGPNRMAPNTALCLMLCGGALLTFDAPRRWLARTGDALAVMGATVALLAALGYLYHVDALYRVGPLIPMAVHTSLALLALSACTLLARPEVGLVGIVASRSAGGVMARRLLPAITGAVVLLSWLRLEGERAGLYEKEFGVALMAASMIALSVGFIVACAARLNHADEERAAAQRALERVNDELEERVQERTADLLRSNRELEQFAYVASHDLQEPLRMVGSYLQLLERRYKGKLDEEADEFIAFAVDGATRMKQLINDLLTFSRVGRRGGAMSPTDLGEAARQAMLDLRALLEESGAEVHLGALPTVRADPTQMRQLFMNLIGNAVKFRGMQKPRIEIGAERRGGAWEVWVTDNGIGIDPKYAERVFEIFQRLHSREEYPGTGIGLAICKKIVERHGGQIRVRPAEGGGSTFTFTLPVQESRHDRASRAA